MLQCKCMYNVQRAERTLQSALLSEWVCVCARVSVRMWMQSQQQQQRRRRWQCWRFFLYFLLFNILICAYSRVRAPSIDDAQKRPHHRQTLRKIDELARLPSAKTNLNKTLVWLLLSEWVSEWVNANLLPSDISEKKKKKKNLFNATAQDRARDFKSQCSLSSPLSFSIPLTSLIFSNYSMRSQSHKVSLL